MCFVGQEQAGVTHRSTGGIGNWMAAVTQGLARRGHEIHVIVPVPRGADRDALGRPDRITVHALASLPQGPLDVVSHWTFPRSVARQAASLGRFDAVIAQDYSGPAAAYARSARPSPLVTHLHSTSVQIGAMTADRRGGRLTPVLQPMQAARERRQLGGSDALAGCSSSVLADTMRRYELAGKPSTVLHSFVDVQRIQHQGRGRYAGPLADSPDPLVVFAGRLYGLKGVQELAQAMHQLWSGGSTARLVLAGTDGNWGGRPMIERLRALAEPHADRVHHLGGIDHEQLFPLLRRAAVVAMPSYWEALPLALVEAVALGTPLVTTTGHGADDVLTDGVDGLLVPPRDSAALATAIGRLLHDPELAARLAAAARERGDYFDVGPGLERFERFYAALPARGGAGVAAA